MVSKSSRGGQAPFPRNRKQLAQFRHDVAILKEKGLVSSRVDPRKQWPSAYMRRVVAGNRDVLTGKAKVLKLPSRKAAKEFDANMRVKGRSVVVPVTNKSERVSYRPSTGEIRSTSRENGRKLTKIVRQKNVDLYDIKTYPRGDNIRYRMPFGNSSHIQFDTPEDLFAEMFKYETKPVNPYRNWQNYVQIIYIDEDGDEGDD